MNKLNHPTGTIWYTSKYILEGAERGEGTARDSYCVDESGKISRKIIQLRSPDFPTDEEYNRTTKALSDFCRHLGYTKFRNGISNSLRKSKDWDEFVSLISKNAMESSRDYKHRQVWDLAKQCPHLGKYLVGLVDRETIIHDDGFDVVVAFNCETSAKEMHNALCLYKEELFDYIKAVHPMTNKFNRIEGLQYYYPYDMVVLRSHEILVKYIVKNKIG